MFKNVFKVLSSNGIVALAGLLSSLFLPNLLSIDEYAAYQTFILYVSYVALFHLGFPNGLSIKYAGKAYYSIEKSQLKAEMMLLLIIISIFSLALILVYAGSKNILILYVAIMTFCVCYLGAVTQLLQAWEMFGLYALCHVTISVLPLALPLAVFFLFGSINSQICIGSYLFIYGIVTIFFLFRQISLGRKIQCARLLSKENLDTEITGALFHIGSYINVLLHNVDKQLIKWFCSVQEFSYYSFAITMQSTMTIFLTAISQPLFPYIASGKLGSKNKIIFAKRSLLMLGSLSGVAFYACSVIVELWIPKYVNSLEIIRVYFALFPAMAVINCLYFNFYKVKKLKYRYTIDLTIMLCLTIILDLCAVGTQNGHIGVAVATVIVYYIWLLYGMHVFPELKFDSHEYEFVAIYIILFFSTQYIKNNFIGMMAFLVADFSCCWLLFKKEVKEGINATLVYLK